MPLPFVANTYSFTMSHTAEACLEDLAAVGFKRFELMMYPNHAWPAEWDAGRRRDFRAFLEARDLQVVSINMPNVDLNLTGATKEMRQYTLGILRSIIQLAGDLGVRQVVICPGKPNALFPAPRQHLIGLFYAALDELLPVARSGETQLLIENVPFSFLPDAASLADVIDAYGNPDIGLVYDVANAAFIGEHMPTALRRILSRLKLVHASDTSRTLFRHDPVGMGTIDFAEVWTHLADIGWTDWPVLEIISSTSPSSAVLRDSAHKLQSFGWGRVAKHM